METLVGCCGWSEARAAYLSQFPTVELQTPFYEMPSLLLALKWKQSAPPPFLFCMKAWQLITHTAKSPTYRRLKAKLSEQEREDVGAFQPTEPVALAWERTRDVALALGAAIVVFQCPKSFLPERKNIANFRTFFTGIERAGLRLAWEPRGEWPAELVRDLCAEFGLIHCVDPFETQSVFGAEVYWRLHGRTGYSYRYTQEDFTFLRERLDAHRDQGRTRAWVLFNNIRRKDDARIFQSLLTIV